MKVSVQTKIFQWTIGNVVLGSVFLLWVLAQDMSAPVLQAEITPTENLNVGDVLELTLTATFPRGWTVSFSGLGEKVGELEVRDTRLEPIATEQDMSRQQMKAFLTIFKTGPFEIPELSATFVDPEGTHLEKYTQPIPIEITSVLSEESTALKDLKPQAEIAENYLWVWVGLLVILAVAGLAYFLKRRYTGRKGLGEKAITAIPLPLPHEEARRALEALLAKKLMTSGLLKQFYFELSEIIRRMVGRQYGIVTLERTTGEVLFELRDVPHEPLSADSLEKFLTQCDLIKFAKYQPMPPEQEELLYATRGFIDTVKKSYDLKHSRDEDKAETRVKHG